MWLALGDAMAWADSPLEASCGAFMKAVQATPQDPPLPLTEKMVAYFKASGQKPPVPPDDRLLLKNLQEAMDRGLDSSALLLVKQLMATHSAVPVQVAGEALTKELNLQLFDRTKALDGRITALLEKFPATLKSANVPSDLDGILEEMRGMRATPLNFYPGGSIPTMNGALDGAYQYLTIWQNYLSARQSGDVEKTGAQLRQLLNSSTPASVQYIPRSELLAMLITTNGGNPKANPSQTRTGAVGNTEEILLRIKTLDDVTREMAALDKSDPTVGIPRRWDALHLLNQTRSQLASGLPVNLDLAGALNARPHDGDIGRILAMEWMAIIPLYLGTAKSDPPKSEETVKAYIDRLATTADEKGDLRLLQRVLMLELGMMNSHNRGYPGSQQMLAGLSLEEAGEIEAAVLNYEFALTSPDLFLPVTIVGHRLAVLRKAHPKRFEAAYADYLANPGMPIRWLSEFPRKPLIILPIPEEISVKETAKPPAK